MLTLTNIDWQCCKPELAEAEGCLLILVPASGLRAPTDKTKHQVKHRGLWIKGTVHAYCDMSMHNQYVLTTSDNNHPGSEKNKED